MDIYYCTDYETTEVLSWIHLKNTTVLILASLFLENLLHVQMYVCEPVNDTSEYKLNTVRTLLNCAINKISKNNELLYLTKKPTRPTTC